jgi:response regulator RpfG family c-di-GMP phosphodiesterase
VASAEAALVALSRNTVSLIVADHFLPGMTGIDFFKIVRQKWPDTFRLLLTAATDSQTVIEAINQGHVFRFLAKPWDNDELRTVVRDGLRRYELTARNRQLSLRIVRQTTELRSHNELLELKVAERTSELEAKRVELEKTMLEVVRTLSNIVQMRGVGRQGHAEHVSAAADWIAQRLELSADQRRDLNMAALLHDIGKVALPDELVRKDTFAFNRMEASLFREHPTLGQSVIAGIRGLEGVGRIVRYQAEWFNGTGYPDGLAGDAIPIGSRIIGVVDYYEERQDLIELERWSGRRFDPSVVSAFTAYLQFETTKGQGAGVRPINLHELAEGMTLVNDIYTGRGLLLVAGSKKVDLATLEKIRKFNQVDPIRNKIYVRG